MRRACAFVYGLAFAVLCLACARASDVPAFTAPDLRTVIHRSGYIFRGTVVAVQPASALPLAPQPPRERPPGWKGRASPFASQGGRVPAVAITFRVTDAIRGVRVGQVITLAEWSGLWLADPARYRPGDDLLICFYPKSRAGLSSPVAGGLGRFAIAADGRMALTEAQRRMLFPGQTALSRAAIPRPSELRYKDFADLLRAEAGR